MLTTITKGMDDLAMKVKDLTSEARDSLLDYILQGTRQFELSSSFMTIFSSLASILIYGTGRLAVEITPTGRWGMVITSIVQLFLGIGLVYGLSSDNRNLRREFSRYIALTWLARIVILWISYGDDSLNWIVNGIYCLFFAGQSTVAYLHHAVIKSVKDEKEKS